MSPAHQLVRTSAIAFGLCLAVGFNSAAVGADETATAPEQVTATPVHRPRIGLVLAGGGAKGGAHVGVIKVLEEQHVPIDCIAGTSMGALVGGGYAAGMPAAALETFIAGIDWNFVVGGVGRRRARAHRAKTPQNGRILGFRAGHAAWPARGACRARRHQCHRRPAQDLRSPGSHGCRFRPASYSVSRGCYGHGDRQDGRAQGRRPRDGDARKHGHSGGIRARGPQGLHPDRRRPGQEHSRRCRP